MPKLTRKPGTELTRLAERIEADLNAIRRLLRQPLESQFQRGNLTPPQTAVMRSVVRHDGISLKDLSREVSLAHSTVSGIVDRLAKRGLIDRRPDPGDGRVARIHPAAAVTRFLQHEMPALVLGPLQKALSLATSEEHAQIEHSLRRLRELLDSISAQG